MTVPEKPQRTPLFEPGAKVRVRYGVTVPGFEDIPLGGWTGVIGGVEPSGNRIDYEVEWDRRTLDAMHPVYRKRCERDDLGWEAIWLTEGDVEPDDGTPVPIEQPSGIKTPPLSERDRDDRVRKALGLTHDDPIPEITLQTLHAYHRYLTADLNFPFTAYCGEEQVGPFSRKRATMTVTGLLDPARGSLALEDGLFCLGRGRDGETEFPLAEIEVRKKDPNSRLLSDYAYWFHNWPCRDEGDSGREDDDREIEAEIMPPTRAILIMVALILGVGGCLLGATIGAALGTLNGAGMAAIIGGVPLGMIGAFLLGRYGRAVGAVYRLRYETVLGVIFGLVGGGLVGVIAGLTVVALPWSLSGLIAGMFLGPYVIPQRRRRLISLRAASLGTCGGILISAFRHDRARATSGAVPGLITGLLVAVGLVLILAGAVYLMPRAPTGYDETDEEADEFEDEEQDEDDPVDDGGGGLQPRRT